MALMPFEDALEKLLDGSKSLTSETVALSQATDRILAQDLTAKRTQPPFPACAMDGYALRVSDIANIPAELEIIGESAAGHGFTGQLAKGQCVRIFTGAPVPENADAIIIQENVSILSPTRVRIKKGEPEGRHIRRAGLDFRHGDVVLKAGHRLDAAAISLAAAANHPTLNVVRRPKVAILATGDELVAPGAPAGPDQIVASNSFGIATLARQAGAEPMDLGIVPDDSDEISRQLSVAKEAQADLIVTLGGASVGDHDLVHDALTKAGVVLDFWKIAMRPGKPLMVGRWDRMHVMGLPGNPVSSLVCAYLFMIPLLARLGGRPYFPDYRSAQLTRDMPANDGRRDFVRARCYFTRYGNLAVTPFDRQDSSMLSTLAQANCLVSRPPDAPQAASGTEVSCFILQEPSKD